VLQLRDLNRVQQKYKNFPTTKFGKLQEKQVGAIQQKEFCMLCAG
jgi:hypothetical protein